MRYQPVLSIDERRDKDKKTTMATIDNGMSTYPSNDHCELGLFAMHTDIGLVIGYPDGGMMFYGFFSAYKCKNMVKFISVMARPTDR